MRDPLESRRRPCHPFRLTPFSSWWAAGPVYRGLFSLYAGAKRDVARRQMEMSRDKRALGSAASSLPPSDGLLIHHASSDRLDLNRESIKRVFPPYHLRRAPQKRSASFDLQQEAASQSSCSDSSDTASIRFERSLRPSHQSSSRSTAHLVTPERSRPSTPAANRRNSHALAKLPATITSSDSAAGSLPVAFCRFRLCTCAVEYEDEETTTSEEDPPHEPIAATAQPEA